MATATPTGDKTTRRGRARAGSAGRRAPRTTTTASCCGARANCRHTSSGSASQARVRVSRAASRRQPTTPPTAYPRTAARRTAASPMAARRAAARRAADPRLVASTGSRTAAGILPVPTACSVRRRQDRQAEHVCGLVRLRPRARIRSAASGGGQAGMRRLQALRPRAAPGGRTPTVAATEPPGSRRSARIRVPPVPRVPQLPGPTALTAGSVSGHTAEPGAARFLRSRPGR
jgi:hypothetical protein